jgi:hypothetical protein
MLQSFAWDPSAAKSSPIIVLEFDLTPARTRAEGAWPSACVVPFASTASQQLFADSGERQAQKIVHSLLTSR